VFLVTPVVLAQNLPTARRGFDLQVGGGFVLDQSDYDNQFKGFAFYTTLDPTSHLGGEFVIHSASSGNGDQSYQRTYEIGPRYHRDYGRFSPYVKAMYGRGVFNYPTSAATLAYNIFAVGGGVDFHVKPWLNVRGDFEYQDWFNFPPRGLTPTITTIGVAYHFPGQLGRQRHW
jgi:Outer membrane protein beta-barrel domain